MSGDAASKHSCCVDLRVMGNQLVMSGPVVGDELAKAQALAGCA
jgi:hypothetical protein